jgi:hypothetical protein
MNSLVRGDSPAQSVSAAAPHAFIPYVRST